MNQSYFVRVWIIYDKHSLTYSQLWYQITNIVFLWMNEWISRSFKERVELWLLPGVGLVTLVTKQAGMTDKREMSTTRYIQWRTSLLLSMLLAHKHITCLHHKSRISVRPAWKTSREISFVHVIIHFLKLIVKNLQSQIPVTKIKTGHPITAGFHLVGWEQLALNFTFKLCASPQGVGIFAAHICGILRHFSL